MCQAKVASSEQFGEASPIAMKPHTRKQSIYDLLGHIQKRPAMYLRRPTLDSLSDFLTGFSVGRNFGLHSNNKEPSFDDFSAWFCIHLQAPCAGPGGWYGAITDESRDEKEAFDRFFQYLAAYRRRVPLLEYHFTLSPAQRKLYAAAQRSSAPRQLRLTRYKGECCLFLHARMPGRPGWYMHSGFNSLPYSRQSLAKTFGITDAQWRQARKGARPRA